MVWPRALSKAAGVALLTLVAAVGATAQTHYNSHIWLGARGGVTLSRMDISPSITQTMKTGTTGAVTFRYAEEKLFGLVAELGFVQRGWKEQFNTPEETSPLQYSRTLTYVNLPVMTQIIFGTNRFKGFVNLGPEVSYLVSEGTTANFDYRNPTAAEGWPKRPRQYEHLAMAVHNKFDYGITGGAGIEVYVAPRHSLTLEARYYFGLGNIFHSSKADVYSASRCTSIEVTLGYNFRLK